MLTVKGYFENGEVRLSEDVKMRAPGPVLVTFLDPKEMNETEGLTRFLESPQRSLDSTVLTREQIEQHQKEKENAARDSSDSARLLRDS